MIECQVRLAFSVGRSGGLLLSATVLSSHELRYRNSNAAFVRRQPSGHPIHRARKKKRALLRFAHSCSLSLSGDEYTIARRSIFSESRDSRGSYVDVANRVQP